MTSLDGVWRFHWVPTVDERPVDLEHAVPLDTPGAMRHHFETDARQEQARFVRVHGRSIGVCPEGHWREGWPALINVDEIVVLLPVDADR